MIVTLIQTLCALVVVYGAFLAVVYAFDIGRRRPDRLASRAQPFHSRLREEG